MSEKDFGFSIDDLLGWIDEDVLSKRKNPSQPQQPENNIILPPTELARYPIGHRDAQSISKIEDDLINKIEFQDPFEVTPDNIAIDHMPTLKRIYTEEVPIHSKDLQVKPNFLEFLYYPDPSANPYSEILDFEVKRQFSIGLHTDQLNTSEAKNDIANTGLYRFDPITTYILDSKENDLIKICKLAPTFNDTRQDLLPSEPSGHFVLSSVRLVDIILFQSYLNYLSEELERR